MIQLLIISIAFYAILASFGCFQAKRRGALYWSDLATPILVVLCWLVLTAVGYGHQSLSHLVEVPVALTLALVMFYLRVFGLDKINADFRRNSYMVLVLSLVAVFALRTFMPYLPE